MEARRPLRVRRQTSDGADRHEPARSRSSTAAASSSGTSATRSAGRCPSRCRGSTTTPNRRRHVGHARRVTRRHRRLLQTGVGALGRDDQCQSRSTPSASVPWWPEERRETTLHRLLVHVIAETNRHAGHADILRELIDGSGRPSRRQLEPGVDRPGVLGSTLGAGRRGGAARRRPRTQLRIDQRGLSGSGRWHRSRQARSRRRT